MHGDLTLSVKKDIKSTSYAFHVRLGYDFMYKDGNGQTQLRVNQRERNIFTKNHKDKYKLEWFKQDVYKFLKEVQNEINDKKSDYDALIVNWSGHGEPGDILVTTSDKNKDEPHIHLNNVMKYFNDENCPKLKHKPRIFFVDSCRGSGGVQNRSEKEKAAYKKQKMRTPMETLREMARFRMDALKDSSKVVLKKNVPKVKKQGDKSADISVSDEKSNDYDMYDPKIQNEKPLTHNPWFMPVFSTLANHGAANGARFFKAIRKVIQKITKDPWHDNNDANDANDEKDEKDNNNEDFDKFDLMALLMFCRDNLANTRFTRQYIDYSRVRFVIYFDENTKHVSEIPNGPAEMKQDVSQGSIRSFSSFE